jgi:hypothetical protein
MRHLLFSLMLLAAISCSPEAQRAESPMVRDTSPLPSLTCHRTAPGSITVDGVIDERAWSASEIASLRLNSGPPATHRTIVRTLWDDENIYFAFDCEDPNPVGHMTQRDDALFNEPSVVEVFLTPRAEDPGFYEFEVNPLNTLLDLYYERRDQPWPEAAKWNAEGIQTAVHIRRGASGATEGWSVEMAIPWRTFHTAGCRPPRAGDRWRANFYRYDTISAPTGGNRLELSAWSSTLEEKFDVPERFGHLIFGD